MKTIVCRMNPEVERDCVIMNFIIENFPCFIWEDGDKTCIQCRQEDSEAIEQIIYGGENV